MDSVFKFFISRPEETEVVTNKRLAYASWFLSSFPVSEFSKEECVFYGFMEYCISLGIIPKYKYLEIYLATELKKFLAKTSTKVVGTEALNFDEPAALESAILTTSSVMKSAYKELEELEAPIEDFTITVKTFMRERQNEKLVKVFERAYSKISAKDDITAAVEYTRDEVIEIGDMYDPSVLEELVESDGNFGNDAMEFLLDTGISAIDRVLGGIFRKQLFGIEAAPGDGKTRFALGCITYRAITVYKLNVIYFALEQSKGELKAILTARHVLELFGKIVSDKMIFSNTVPEELQPLVDAAELDLYESGKYGRIDIQATNLEVESFTEKMRNQNRSKGPYDVFIIDHMYMLGSSATGYDRLNEAQIIQRGYRKFKRFVRSKNVVGVAVNQFNREGVDASRGGKGIDASMIAGGIECHRNIDADIALCCTDVMKVQGVREAQIPKNRSSEYFNPVILNTRLGCAYWYQPTKRVI